MKPLIYLVVLLVATTSARIAHAAGVEIHSCDFEVKARCVSGDARVTLADGTVKRVEVEVYWCGLPHRPAIDSSRGDEDSQWSEDGGATLIANTAPANPNEPDRVKVTVGKNVSIDLGETQSLGRCGAGAALSQAIVIPAQKALAVCGLEIPNAQCSLLALR
jgi:hypothetical protein